MWVVSKNESNWLLENKMVSTLIRRRDKSAYCSLFSRTFDSLLFSYLTITDVTSYVHHHFPVSFLLYIATKKPCQINQIITVNSSMNAHISETLQKKKTLARLACLCVLAANVAGQVYKLERYSFIPMVKKLLL